MSVFLNYPTDYLRIDPVRSCQYLLLEICLLYEIISIQVQVGNTFPDDVYVPQREDASQDKGLSLPRRIRIGKPGSGSKENAKTNLG